MHLQYVDINIPQQRTFIGMKKNINKSKQQSLNKNILQQNKSQMDKHELEFHELQVKIKSLCLEQPKNIQIRIRQWLNKLQEVIELEVCQTNRNLYAKVLLIMLKKNHLTQPFNRKPANMPLPILKIYQVSYEVRGQLQKQRHIQNWSSRMFSLKKQNNSQIANHIGFNQKDENKLSKNRCEQRQNIQNRILMKTSAVQQDQQQNYNHEIAQILRQSYDFILKNIEKVNNKQKGEQLLNSIWNQSN